MGVRRRGGDAPGVVVGYVRRQPTHGSWGAGVLVNLGEQIGGRLQVGRPSQPTGMASIHIGGDVGQVELLEGVLRGQQVVVMGVGALGHIHVRHQVSKRVGLDDKQDPDIRVGDELRADRVDVRLVLRGAAVGVAQLAVGGGGGAVTVGEVVHHEQACVRGCGALVCGADVGKGACHQGVDLVGGVAFGESAHGPGSDQDAEGKDSQPLEAGHLGNRGGLGGLGCRQTWDGQGRDLRGIVRVGPLVDANEGVAAVRGGGAGTSRDCGGRLGRGGRGACAGGARLGGCRRRGRGGGGLGRRGGGGAARSRAGQALGVIIVDLVAGRPRRAAGCSRPADSATLGADRRCQCLRPESRRPGGGLTTRCRSSVAPRREQPEPRWPGQRREELV